MRFFRFLILSDAGNQLSGSRQVAEAAKLRADKLQEENAALKKQPIAAVVDEEEVERRANQRAHDIATDLAAEMTADLQARLEQASSGSEQDARDAYDSIILAGRSITSIVQSAKMQFRKLPDDQRETAINQFVHTLASAQGEVSASFTVDTSVDYIVMEWTTVQTAEGSNSSVTVSTKYSEIIVRGTPDGTKDSFSSSGTVEIWSNGDKYVNIAMYHYATPEELNSNLVAAESAQSDADALNVDQDYRLTLLELGVTDDETTETT